MNNHSSLFDQKKILRDSLKQKRAGISQLDRKKHSKIITENLLNLHEIQQAKVIFSYISYATEVSTHELLQNLLDAGKKIVVPKILSPKEMVSQHFQNWDDLEPGTLGILTPKSGEVTDEVIDVAITPGLAFTEKGLRIGFGAGYYDRWFASHKVKLKIAIAFEAQIVASLPAENTDIPVDKILTEKRQISISNSL